MNPKSLKEKIIKRKQNKEENYVESKTEERN